MDWSRKYKKCKNCGTTKTKHKGNGFCGKCWERLVRNKTAKRKQWQKRYRENNMDRIRKNNDNSNHKKRKEVVDLLGGKCKRCGFDDMRALQIDHIKGGGYKEIKNIHSRERIRLVKESIKNNENKYQLLCANCNWIKRYEDKQKRELGGAPRKY